MGAGGQQTRDGSSSQASSGLVAERPEVLEKDFTWVETDEPHTSRRREMLKKYPEIKALIVKEPLTFVIVSFILFTQVLLAYELREASWGWIVFFAYVYGGTVNHTQQLAAHEISHNLCFEAGWANRAVGILANLSTGIPSASTFLRYHMEHHQFQGVDGVDTDVPTKWEVRVFTNAFMKFIWLVLQPAFYAIRPMLVSPKTKNLSEWINVVVVVAFDAVIVATMGYKSMAYLLIGTILGLGFHPCAGHFVAEHYIFTEGHETYSYYGPLNFLNFNVGFHNEHHDFPKIPWSNLPKVRKIAPEYYDNLPHYTSYCAVLYRYIMDPSVGPWSRAVRNKTSDTARKVYN